MIGSDIKRALRHVADSDVYHRGEAYYHGGHVTERHILNDINETAVFVTGEVSGNDEYEAGFLYDFARGEIGENDCTCPYGDFCKHLVALGLVFAEIVQNFSLTPAARTENPADFCPRLLEYIEHGESLAPILSESTAPDMVKLRESLKQLGLSADMIPEEFLGKLLNYRAPAVLPRSVRAPAPPPPKPRPAPKPKKYDLKNYFVVLSGYDNFAPTLRHKDHPEQYASIVKLLEHGEDITQPQRELLEYIRKHGAHQSGARPDFGILLPLLKESGIPAYANYYDHHSYHSRPLEIECDPPKLAATIAYSPIHHAHLEATRHEFYFALTDVHDHNEARKMVVSGKCVVILVDNTLRLYALTDDIARILRRVAPVSRFDPKSKRYINVGNQATLSGEEVLRLNEIITDASRLLDLTTENLAPTYEITHHVEAPLCFVVDYDATASKLSIIAAIDYGPLRQDVSRSVYVSRRTGGDVLARREIWGHDGVHLVIVEDDRIDVAKVQPEKEFALYESLRHADLGFTKTLILNKSGSRRIAEFIDQYWTPLEAFAAEKS
jgi:hypothetical protein